MPAVSRNPPRRCKKKESLEPEENEKTGRNTGEKKRDYKAVMEHQGMSRQGGDY